VSLSAFLIVLCCHDWQSLSVAIGIGVGCSFAHPVSQIAVIAPAVMIGFLMIEMRPVPGFPGYLAGSDGKVYKNATGRGIKAGRGLYCMKGNKTGYGYIKIFIRQRGRTLAYVLAHRMICEAFNGPPPSPAHVVRHLDGDRTNNVPSNLAWGTHRDNCDDAVAHGSLKGTKNGRNRLTESDVVDIRRQRASGVTGPVLAEKYGVSLSTIYMAARSSSWSHI
jgi:hypothetical protein